MRSAGLALRTTWISILKLMSLNNSPVNIQWKDIWPRPTSCEVRSNAPHRPGSNIIQNGLGLRFSELHLPAVRRRLTDQWRHSRPQHDFHHRKYQSSILAKELVTGSDLPSKVRKGGVCSLPNNVQDMASYPGRWLYDAGPDVCGAA